MRLIGGLLRLDGGTASIDTLRAMAAAMTAPGLAPKMFHSLDGPMGMFWLDFSASLLPSAPPEGWLIAADMRLNDLAGSTVRGCEADAHMQAVEAVEQAGPDFPDRLWGDFAVALWERDEGRLWLGRDAMGIRPLAYCHRPGNWFAFASLPKALHRTGLASCRPDPAALADIFVRTYFHDGDSGFSDIRYLRQGHSLSITSKDCAPREHRAWRPDPGLVGSWRHGPEAAAEELRHLVTRAVSSCLPPNGPIGCELSGGLDSSSIAVLAAREMRNRQGHVIAISQIDDEHPAIVVDDDRHLMQAVLEQEPDIQWFGAPAGNMLAEFDEDLPNSVFGARWHVFHNVLVNAGADILLSGVGGDEGASFAGRGLYLELLRQGYWRRLSTELSERAKLDGQSLAGAIRDRLLRPAVPESIKRYKQLRRGKPDVVDIRRFYLRQPFCDRYRRTAVRSSWRPEERISLLTNGHLPGRCVLHAIYGGTAGVEYRFPLLDRRVLEFMLSLPVDHFLANGWNREPFRTSMRGILPEIIRTWRHKYTPISGYICHMSHRKQWALEAMRRVRDDEAANAIFDIEAILSDLTRVPEGEAAVALAQRLQSQGRSPSDLPHGAKAALVAARIASHAARLSDLSLNRIAPAGICQGSP